MTLIKEAQLICDNGVFATQRRFSLNSEKWIKSLRHESGSIEGSSLLPVSWRHCGITSVSYT